MVVDKTEIIDRAVKRAGDEREFDFMAFENKWLKKLGNHLIATVGTFVTVIAVGAIALYQLNGLDEALAEKVDIKVHKSEHETTDLKVSHVEQAVVDLANHSAESDKRIEQVNYHLQQQQEVKFNLLLEAIKEK